MPQMFIIQKVEIIHFIYGLRMYVRRLLKMSIRTMYIIYLTKELLYTKKQKLSMTMERQETRCFLWQR